MKTYKVKNSDFFFTKKLYPEGSTVSLEPKDAELYKEILEPVSVSENSNVTIIPESNNVEPVKSKKRRGRKPKLKADG